MHWHREAEDEVQEKSSGPVNGAEAEDEVVGKRRGKSFHGEAFHGEFCNESL